MRYSIFSLLSHCTDRCVQILCNDVAIWFGTPVELTFLFCINAPLLVNGKGPSVGRKFLHFCRGEDYALRRGDSMSDEPIKPQDELKEVAVEPVVKELSEGDLKEVAGGVPVEYKAQKADGSLDAGIHFKIDLKY
jgi:hypothetical protein